MKGYSETDHYGDKPQGCDVNPYSQIELTKAFNWFNAMCFNKKKNSYEFAKDFLLKYFKNDKKRTKKIRSLSDKNIPLTVGWIAELFNTGMEDNDILHDKVRSCIDELQEESIVPKIETTISVYDRVQNQVSFYIGEIEHELDCCNNSFDFKEYCSKHDIKPKLKSMIVSHFEKTLQEYNENDHTYFGLSKNNHKKCITLLSSIVEQNKNVLRRTNKKQSKVKRFKGILRSVKKETISYMIIFKKKTKQLILLCGNDLVHEEGKSVKGIDSTISCMKKVKNTRGIKALLKRNDSIESVKNYITSSINTTNTNYQLRETFRLKPEHEILKIKE